MINIHGITLTEILELINSKKAQRKQITLHPNGFLQLSLHDHSQPNTDGLRLHLWPEPLQVQHSEFMVHDHVFDFASYVLFGSLENHLYSVEENETGEYFLFVPPRRLGADITNTLVNTGIRVQSQLTKIEQINAREIYKVNKGYFHKTVASIFPTATLVKLSNSEDAVPRIVVPQLYDPKDLTFDRLGFNQERAWMMVSQVGEIIRREYHCYFFIYF